MGWKDCPRCNGTGRIGKSAHMAGGWKEESCPRCGGSGRVRTFFSSSGDSAKYPSRD